MGLHAWAYGLFLFSTVLSFGSFMLYVVLPVKMLLFYVWCNTFMYLVAFVAQLLLCAILWDLGTPVHDRTESHESLKVEDFDEEAEVQARIWNSFNREQLAKSSTAEHAITLPS